MAKHVFVVLTNPVEGKEDAYNCSRSTSSAAVLAFIGETYSN